MRRSLRASAAALALAGCTPPFVDVALPTPDRGTLAVDTEIGDRRDREVFDLSTTRPVWAVEAERARLELAHFDTLPAALGVPTGPYQAPDESWLSVDTPPPARLWRGTLEDGEFSGWDDVEYGSFLEQPLRRTVGTPCARLVATTIPSDALGAGASPRWVGELDGTAWVDPRRPGAPVFAYDGERFLPRSAFPAPVAAVQRRRDGQVEVLTEDGQSWLGPTWETLTGTTAPGWPAGYRVVAAAVGFGDSWVVARGVNSQEWLYLYRRDGAWETFDRKPPMQSIAHCLAIAEGRGLCLIADDVSSPTLREPDGRTRRSPVALGSLVNALGGLALAPSGAVLLGGPGGRVLSLESDGWRELASPRGRGIAKFVGLIFPFGQRVMLVSVTEFAEYDDNIEAACRAESLVTERLSVVDGMAWRGSVLVSPGVLIRVDAVR